MANLSKPSGLKPVSYLNGAPYTGQARLYSVASGNGTALYVGHPVTLSGTCDADGVAGVSVGVAGSAIIGSIVGIMVAAPGPSLVAGTLDLATRSLPISTAGYVMVADDPNLIFEIQDGVAAGTALVDIGLNTNFVIAAGATTYSDSATTTSTSVTDTTTANLKLMGFAQRVDNTVASQYAKLLVKINNHVYGASTGTAGV